MKPTVTNAIAQSPCRLPCISVGPLQVGVGCALIGETSYEDECPTHRSAPGRLGHHVGRSRVSIYSCRNHGHAQLLSHSGLAIVTLEGDKRPNGEAVHCQLRWILNRIYGVAALKSGSASKN